MNTDTEAVIDASTIVASLTLEQHSNWASNKLAQYGYFHALDLTHYEVANALLNKVRQKELTRNQAEAALDEASKLMNLFSVHSFSEVVKRAMKIGLETDVSEYDAAYLYLATILGTNFVTADVKLDKKLKNTDYHKLIECPES